ncbi:MAG TPA: O-antigen ligase family protein [Planctomycetes bacterium]|uniref:O-antigen ligase family protein n=1 Tax=Henriciella sp. TaxID=1968823 RepID=UPI00184617E4|nr:O-antigen ligase family protein [Henriciella sp.]HIG21949.1 O-antigen ligase family protein [Henriciella sp.]HIM29173.1 O-antigen ligase family protein [Planctomycetota bacterium]
MSSFRTKRGAMQLGYPILLGLSILFGGSSLIDSTSRAWLSFASAALIFVALPFAIRKKWTYPARAAAGLFLMWLAWSFFQLIPLPSGVWQTFGERAVVEQGLRLLGMDETRAMPISLSAHSTWLSVIGTLPAVAAFITIVTLGRRTAIATIDWAIPLLGAASAVLGLAQVLLSDNHNLYFYEITNRGLPVGVFANVNHQACFLLMCLPFVAVLINNLRRNWAASDNDYAKAFVIAAVAGLILVGILAAGSVAGYAMLALVLVCSTLLARKPKTSERKPETFPAIVIGTTLTAVVLVTCSPILNGLGVTSVEISEMTRLGIWQVSGEIANDHWLAGTGPGSFSNVYRLYEDPDTVTTTFANHAHNDYLEAVIEFGLPGTLVVVAGVILMLILITQSWTGRKLQNKQIKRAASIALLVALLHSFVDYPVRTPAIASLVATCFAILVLSSDDRTKRRKNIKERADFASSEDDRRLVI